MDAMTIAQCLDGWTKSLANAERMIAEANLLLDNGYHERAFTLADLAGEELVKPALYFGRAMYLALGLAPDWKVMDKMLTNHLAKTNMRLVTGYISTHSLDGEEFASGLLATREQTEVLNRLKNGSLYGEKVGGSVMSPSDLISPEFAADTLRDVTATLHEMQVHTASLQSVGALSEAGFMHILTQDGRAELMEKVLSAMSGVELPDVTDTEEAIKAVNMLFADPILRAAVQEAFSEESDASIVPTQG